MMSAFVILHGMMHAMATLEGWELYMPHGDGTGASVSHSVAPDVASRTGLHWDGATVAAGTVRRGSGAARDARLGFRGLPALWHASGTAEYLLHLGFVMLGAPARL
jgi:hypothetical protein